MAQDLGVPVVGHFVLDRVWDYISCVSGIGNLWIEAAAYLINM